MKKAVKTTTRSSPEVRYPARWKALSRRLAVCCFIAVLLSASASPALPESATAALPPEVMEDQAYNRTPHIQIPLRPLRPRSDPATAPKPVTARSKEAPSFPERNTLHHPSAAPASVPDCQNRLPAAPGIPQQGEVTGMTADRPPAAPEKPSATPADENGKPGPDLSAKLEPALMQALEDGSALLPYRQRWGSSIAQAAMAHGVPASLIHAVIATESSYRHRATSHKGAQGLMQLMPIAQRSLGLTNPYDPEANILAGTAYLRRQWDRFGSLELALAAYNAGPTTVSRHNGIPPFPETRNFVRKVLWRMQAELYNTGKKKDRGERKPIPEAERVFLPPDS